MTQSLEGEILKDASVKIARFKSIGLHYNLVANQIYAKRRGTDPFDESFLPYIIAGLISFDMTRKGIMGKQPYEFFAARLRSKLQCLRPLLKPLMNLALTQTNLQERSDNIIKSYNALAAKGEGALHAKGKHFPVGTTKILHFLNPRLFIIIDSNAARAFGLPFRNGQPEYSAELYIQCMEKAQEDIRGYGAMA